MILINSDDNNIMNISKRFTTGRIVSFLVLVLVMTHLLGSSPVVHHSSLETIEVVATIPVETELGYLGVASTATTWVEMIKSAEKTIDMAHFYLSSKENEILEPVLAEILSAADRGVKVRFLVGTPLNSSMAERTADVKKRLEKHSNIYFTIFNWKALTGGILHAKYFIVDDSIVFVGSQNFDWRSLKHIHETGLKIRNTQISSALKRIFEADWQYNRGDRSAYQTLKISKPFSFDPGIQLVSSPEFANPPGVNASLKTLIQLIDGAKKKITVQLLNYHIDIYKSSKTFTKIDEALRRAAGRGVSVKMLVADWNKRNPGVNGLKGLTGVKGITVKFATIPGHSGGFIPYARVIHSKVMRIDDSISWVGTSNWGLRYFKSSRNIEVITHNLKVATDLDRLFDHLWSSRYTYPVDPEKEYTPPRISQ